MFDEGSEDEMPVVKRKQKAPLENFSATAKLRKQLADFLDVEEEEGSDEDVDQMETLMEEQVEGEKGLFRRGGVVYDLNDAAEVKETEEDEDEEPARKKAKTTKGKPKKIDKDLAVHMKIKSTLEALEKSNQAKAEIEEEEGEDDVSMEEDDEENAVELKWKDNLAQKASEAFYQRLSGKGNLRKLVYGTETANELDEKDASASESEDGDEDRLGGLFKIASEKRRERQSVQSNKDNIDCSRFVVEKLQDWTKADVLDGIRDCFVTGKWKENEDAEELLAMDDLEMDSEEDFEDLETGEVSKAKKPDNAKDLKEEDDESPEETRRKLMEKKRKLKEQFDAEYDDHKEGKGKTYYDELKEELDQQAKLNKSEFEDLDDEIRVQYEGFRPGMYVRMEIADVPCELVTNFNPTYPLIVGALLAGEENIGFVQVFLHTSYVELLMQPF